MARRFLITLLLLFPLLTEAAEHPLSLKARTAFQRNDFREALDHYNELIQLFPEAAGCYFNRGLCLYRTERYAEAKLDFNAALEQDEKISAAKYLTALTLEKSGNEREAQIIYGKILKERRRTFDAGRRIQKHRLAVLISKKWYYAAALLLISILLPVLGVPLVKSRNG